MSMKTLERAFSAYLNLAKAELRPQQAKPQSQRPIQLLETSSMKLRRLVEGIEMSPDFGSLVALVWFLNYVDHVLHETRHDSALPTREELLSVLDLKSERRERVKHLLKILPADFPNKSDWLDQ